MGAVRDWPAIAADVLSGPVTSDGHTPNYLRNLLELTSFAATTVLVLTGLIAVVFTYAQLKEAKNARIASVYLQISAKWNAEEAFASRMGLLELNDRFEDRAYSDATKSASRSAEDYISRSIEAEGRRDRAARLRLTFILSVMEDIGVLCARGMIDQDIVLDLLASPIAYQMQLLSGYVESLRRDEPGVYRFASALGEAARRRDSAIARAVGEPARAEATRSDGHGGPHHGSGG
jgi:hypothetical protein